MRRLRVSLTALELLGMRDVMVKLWTHNEGLFLFALHSPAAALLQGFATVASPTAAPHQDPGRPERGDYLVNGPNGTACLLANMGLQLNVTYSSQTKVLV